MKWIFTFLFVAMLATDIDRIARINELKEEAREAYNAGDYEKALENYRYLVDSMEVSGDKILLNMANTLYQLKDTTAAVNAYNSITGSPDKLIGSVAHQQLGILANRMGNYEEALNHFKQALRKDPGNEDARYNYELLKKVLEEEKKKQEEKQNQEQENNKDQKDKEGDEEKEQDQQQQDQQKQEQNKEGEQENQEQQEQSEEGKENEQQDQKDSEKTKEGEDKEKSQEEKEGTPENQEEQDQQKNEARQKEIAEKLKDMKISEEKARMILEAMKNNEIQYIQQNKRKATRKKDSSKPDW